MTPAMATIIATLAGRQSIECEFGKAVPSPVTQNELKKAEQILGYDEFYKHYDEAVDAAMEWMSQGDN